MHSLFWSGTQYVLQAGLSISPELGFQAWVTTAGDLLALIPLWACYLLVN